MKSRLPMFMAGLVLMGALGGAEEIVITEEGRKVLLKDDYTWEYVPAEAADPLKYADEAVTVWDKALTHTKLDGRDSVTLQFHYKNNTSKKVISVKTRVVVTDPFGEVAFKKTLDDHIILQPQEQKKNNTFWHFNNDPAKTGQPYDELWQLAEQGTAKIEVKVLRVAFEDGTVLKPKPREE